MIIEHIVKGSKETSWHDINLNLNKMDLIISKGSYFQAGIERFKLDSSITITLESSIEITSYEVWLNDSGIQVLCRTEDEYFDEVTSPIDKLLWFTVPANETDLNNIDVHFVKVVE